MRQRASESNRMYARVCRPVYVVHALLNVHARKSFKASSVNLREAPDPVSVVRTLLHFLHSLA
jgi:hypothetical protein